MTRSAYRHHVPPRRRGLAAAEFALVLPVFVVLVLGCVDFGRAVHAQVALTNAARVGAEFGATHRVTPSSRADWESRLNEIVAEEAASIPDFDAARLVIDVTTADEPDGDLRVAVALDYPFRTLVAWPGLPRRVTLEHDVAMRQYR